MKSVVEVEINAPRATVADLFSNPENNTRWMDDVARVEFLGGQPGMPGSTYRLVPKSGKMVFVATVTARDLPGKASLILDAPNVSVSVEGRFVAAGADRTTLISEEVFAFKGFFWRVLGMFAGRAIRSAHRRHIEAFKQFAEQRQ